MIFFIGERIIFTLTLTFQIRYSPMYCVIPEVLVLNTVWAKVSKVNYRFSPLP